MASKIVNEDDESSLIHVSLQPTQEAGIYFVSEPDRKDSKSATIRKNMESELHTEIAKENFVRQFKGDVGKTFNINDFVAVGSEGAYKRGQIVGKIFRNPHTKLQIRLLDWGTTVDIVHHDLVALPKEFISLPFYSRLAVLGGIQPLASMFDPSSPNCDLKLMPTDNYDESGKRFIKDKLKSSSGYKMSVIGLDADDRLHIRLYLKQGASYICLNDMLCELNHAVRISDASTTLQPIEPALSNFWEKLPLLPMQMAILEEKSNCYTVGFSDYAAKFGEMKKERLSKKSNSSVDLNNSYEVNSSSSSLYGSPMKHREEDEPTDDPSTKEKENVDHCSPNNVKTTPFSFGRGRGFLKMLEHLSNHSAKKTSGTVPSNSNGEVLLPLSYEPVKSTSPASVTKEAPIPTTLDELETFADRANGLLCKPNTLQKTNTSSDESSPMLSFSSTSPDSVKGVRKSTDDYYPSLPAIGRGYSGSQLCPPEYAGPNVGWFENNLQHVAESSKINARASNLGNRTTNGIGSTKVAGLKPDLLCSPAGMFTEMAKPVSIPKVGYYKMNNPYTVTGVTRNPVQRYGNFGNHQKPAPRPMEPLVQTSSFGIKINDREEAQPRPKFNPNKRLEALKSALDKAKAKSLEPRVEKPALLQAAEALSDPVDDDEDMEELLMLASGITEPKRSNGSVGRYEEPSMLKSAKLAGMIEEGRVLVSGPIARSPTHNLNETNFDATILEALSRIGIQKPKLIQAHVWEPILSFSDVAYVSGSKTGKTLGYLVPVINNLLDEDIYSEVPKGCSPLAIVICPSWRDAETVHEYFTQMMRSVKGFRSGVLVDGSSKSLNESVGTLVNGVTLLAATAPALRNLFQEANSVINFDRCCHLVFENTDLLLKDHGEAFKYLVELYYSSCKRMKDGGFNFVRQIISCSEHWTKGMQSILDQVMKTPCLFISSCLEAAIYGGMKLDVQHGTSSEMDSSLLKLVQEKRTTRTIVFCRSSDEIAKLQDILSTIGVKPLVAHNRSVVSDLDSINRRWESCQPGCAILLCIDDVLYRLNIKNAQTLIHYFIPTHSKYDFSLRFSFALDRLKSLELTGERPVSHLLITEEFKKALLTIVRIMPRFGHVVPEDLKKEAMLSYCDKEFSKTQLPLCIELKSFGSCRNTKLCPDRHLVMESFDKPVVPSSSGLIRIRITAVHTTTRYYARILKYQSGDKFVDASASRFEVNERMRNHYLSNQVQSALETDVKVGNWYARRSADDLFERVRVEEILNYNHQKIPLEVTVISIDQGCTFSSFVQDLIELPESLKALPPEAIEVYLAGVKPLDKNTEWSRRSIEFVRAKLMNKVLDGHIVLALSSSLWLKPLYERKTLEGMKDKVVVMDILSDLMKEELAVKNDEHIAMLYCLCETGGMVLPDHSLKKKKEVPITIAYAFLSIKDDHEVEVTNVESPSQFYVVNLKFQKILEDLEITIRKNVSKCKKLSSEEAQPGKLVIAEEPGNPGVWCRAVVKKVLNVTHQYQVFFVDYGDFSQVSLNELRALPREFVSRLPFQAIACSLKGLKPAIDSTWTEEAKDYFSSLTRDSGNCLRVLNAIPEAKQQITHEVTGGPHYLIHLINQDEGEPRDLTQEMISSNFALPLENHEDASSSISLIARAEKMKVQAKEKKLREEEEARLAEKLASEEFDVSADWLKDFRPLIPTPPVIANAVPITKCVVVKPHVPSPPDDVSSPKSHKKNEEKDSEGLIAHTMPLKSTSSRFPTTKWSQNDDKVFVNFQLEDVLDYEVDYSSDYLTFAAEVNGLKYELQTTTFRYIIPEQCHHEKTAFGVKVTLRKQQSGFMWNRLIISPFPQQWLTRDFSAWTVTEDTDDKIVVRHMNVDEKYAFEGDHSDSSVSSEGDFLSDDDELKYD